MLCGHYISIIEGKTGSIKGRDQGNLRDAALLVGKLIFFYFNCTTTASRLHRESDAGKKKPIQIIPFNSKKIEEIPL